MSALGQKQTYAVHQLMSALPPIATAKADIGKPSCLLYPRKQTCAVQLGKSALGQKRTCAAQKQMSALPLKADIVDRLEKSASCHEQNWASDMNGGRTFSPQHFCRGKIDDLLELSILGRESGRTLRPWLITACKKIQLLFAFPRLILIFCWATPCGVSACSSNTLRRRSDCATGPFDRPSWYLAALARVPAISWHGGMRMRGVLASLCRNAVVRLFRITVCAIMSSRRAAARASWKRPTAAPRTPARRP